MKVHHSSNHHTLPKSQEDNNLDAHKLQEGTVRMKEFRSSLFKQDNHIESNGDANVVDDQSIEVSLISNEFSISIFLKDLQDGCPYGYYRSHEYISVAVMNASIIFVVCCLLLLLFSVHLLSSHLSLSLASYAFIITIITFFSHKNAIIIRITAHKAFRIL
jgi:hypothetical protein